MASPIKVARLRPGRPKLTEEAKKQRRIAKSNYNSRSVIWTGHQTERWHQLKAEIGAETNVEMTKILIDSYCEHRLCLGESALELSASKPRHNKRKQQKTKPENAFTIDESRVDSDIEDASEMEDYTHTSVVLPTAAKATSKQKRPEESPIPKQCTREPAKTPQITFKPTLVTQTTETQTMTTASPITRKLAIDTQIIRQQGQASNLPTDLDPANGSQNQSVTVLQFPRTTRKPIIYRIIVAPPATKGIAKQPQTTQQVSSGQLKTKKRRGIFQDETSQADSSTHKVKQEQEHLEDRSRMLEINTNEASSKHDNQTRLISQASVEETQVMSEIKIEQEEQEQYGGEELDRSTGCVDMDATVASFDEATVAAKSAQTAKAGGRSISGAKWTELSKGRTEDVGNKEVTVADLPTPTAKGGESSISGAKGRQVNKGLTEDLRNKQAKVTELSSSTSTVAATSEESSTSDARKTPVYVEVKAKKDDHEFSEHDAILPSKPKDLSERSSQKAKQRKVQNEIEFYVRPKKFIVEENYDSTKRRLSTRIRQAGARPDYLEMNNLGDISDLDLDSESESEDTDSDVENIDLVIGEDEFVPSSDEAKSSSDENVDTFTAPDRKEINAASDDPDFECESDSKSDDSSRVDKRKRANIRKRKAERSSVELIKNKRNRIKVTLADHPDKYFEEEFVSVHMKDRGKSKEEKTSKLIVCALCRKFKTENKASLENHLEQHLNGDFKCKICGIEFDSSSEWRLHHHQKERRISKYAYYKCAECPEFYYTQQRINDHMAVVHGKKGFVCRFCSMVLDSRDDLPQHSIDRHKGNIKVCPKCQRYMTKSFYDNHVEKCGQDKRKVPCQICGKELSRGAINSHVKRVHENERIYSCTVCNYSVSDRGKLNAHVQAKHTGERLYKCDDCDFTCVQKCQLTSHRRTHTGETPYKCDLCPYAAAWNVQLKDHKKLHGLPSSITCGECGVLVKNMKSLNLHNKKEHEDKTSV